MKLTRDQQVRKALKVLAPSAAERAECVDEIKSAIEDEVECSDWPTPNSKKVRQAIKKYLQTLRRAQIAHKELFKLDLITGGALAPLPPSIIEEIEFCEEWLKEPTDPPRRTAYKQRAAVKEARTLVLKYCKQKKDATQTKGNKWHSLSAILFGDDRALR